MNDIPDNLNKKLELLKNELEIMVWTEEIPHIIDNQKKKIEELEKKLIP
jgi:hypothetical protein